MEKQVDLFKKDIKQGQRGVYPMIFVLVPLPYQNPKNNTFTRRYENESGKYYLTFHTAEGDIPSGKYPRSLLSIITTQFMRQYKDIKGDVEKRTVELGGINSLVRKIGLTGVQTGGDTGNQTRVKKAMTDLGRLVLTTHSEIITSKFGGIKIENLRLFERTELLWEIKKSKTRQVELFDSYTIISPEFSRMLIDHCVPIDLYVYNELKTARQQDLYAWTSRRFKTVKRESFIPYDAILPQFFDNVTRTSKPRQKDDLRRDLFEITKVYPAAKMKADDSGITLFPSRLLIDEANKGFV